jgi:hypothetical protein
MARKPKTAQRREDFLKHAPATAAGQALGYGLQYTRLTAMLLDAPEGTACSLEVFDDVAEQSPNGGMLLGQTKSSLLGNPAANHSVELWKTFFNWLQLVRSGIAEPERTIFELYVSHRVSGQIVDAFSAAKSAGDAVKAISLARQTLWGDPPGRSDKAALPQTLARYVNGVLEATDDTLQPIIQNFRLTCGSGSPQTDLEAAIRRLPVSKSKVSDIADKLCGWVKRQVDLRLEKGAPAVVARDDFHKEFVAYCRKVDRELILASFAPKPTPDQQLERLPDTFVNQLELIELSFDDKLEAISDFLRACWDRTIWSKKGDVHESSFDDLDDGVCRAWRNLKRSMDIEHGTKAEAARGKLLYSECMQQRIPLQGMVTPEHFIPGCFHRLADELQVGWHPKYKALLSSKPASVSA